MKREVNRLTAEKRSPEKDSEEAVNDGYEESEQEIAVEQESINFIEQDLLATPLDQPKFDCSKCKELKKKLKNQQKKCSRLRKQLRILRETTTAKTPEKDGDIESNENKNGDEEFVNEDSEEYENTSHDEESESEESVSEDNDDHDEYMIEDYEADSSDNEDNVEDEQNQTRNDVQ